jgi:hypothetical protein
VRVKITDHTVVIPELLLDTILDGDYGADEVDINAVAGTLVVMPVSKQKMPNFFSLEELRNLPLDEDAELPPDDPAWQIGTNPAEDTISDASTNLDKYLYGS